MVALAPRSAGSGCPLSNRFQLELHKDKADPLNFGLQAVVVKIGSLEAGCIEDYLAELAPIKLIA
jgi:hypothetical protein